MVHDGVENVIMGRMERAEILFGLESGVTIFCFLLRGGQEASPVLDFPGLGDIKPAAGLDANQGSQLIGNEADGEERLAAGFLVGGRGHGLGSHKTEEEGAQNIDLALQVGERYLVKTPLFQRFQTGGIEAVFEGIAIIGLASTPARSSRFH